MTDSNITNTSITKVSSQFAPHGAEGQKYLASGVHTALRLWENEKPGEPATSDSRDYETVGYVISGKAELTIEGQTVSLAPGDSWVINKGQHHSYKILETFTAVEATTPPARAHGRDEK